jgi:NTE family protein
VARIGLVLGAGGITGQAFHSGVLSALRTGGWDAREADLVVGTSAGAAVGTYLRLGLEPDDLAAVLAGDTPSPAGRALVDRLGPTGDWTAPTLARRWTPPHPRLIGRIVRSPWRVRPEALLGCAVPTGRVPTESWTSALRPVTGDEWPDAPLWICAVRMDDTHRVAFGRPGAPSVDLPSAVGASCAIPGFFAPVVIHGRRYVDGGVHSPTNADLVRREQLDLLIVSSPMSIARSAPVNRPSRMARTHFRVRLGQELRRVARAGTTVVAYQPDERDLAVMGSRTMDPGRVGAVFEQARETTLRRLARRPLPLPRERAS